jgi:RND family efflux transporter MFP subunit
MKRYSLFLASVFLLAAGCSRDKDKTAAAAAPSKGIPIEAAAVEVRSAQRLLEVTGTLQPYDKVTVSSEIDGPVQRVLVDLGDVVTPGQVLAEINPEEFRIQAAQAQARLQQALAQLGIREGQDHRLVRNEDTPEVRRANAILEEAQQNFRRVSLLFEEKIGTQQSVDQARAQLKSAQANLAMTLESIETQRAQIDQFRAALELADKKLKDTAIQAPFAGAVAERLVSTGQYVKAQTPLFTIVQTNPLRLRAEVSERLAPAIRANQPVELRVDGLAGRTFPARIWRISPSVTEQTRTLLVEALVQNDDATLRPGMFARASVQSGELVRALMIPARAVLNFYGVNKVFTVAGGQVQDRTVKLGDRYNEYFEVLEGVREHELIALTNLEKLTGGAAVEVKCP